jgi:hypothetical protein
MGRRLAALVVVVAPVALLATAVSSAAPPVPEQPPKTTSPPNPSATVATTVWPTTSTAGPQPPTTSGPVTSTVDAAAVPTTASTTITFDGFTFLRNFYNLLAVDPFAAAELAEATALGSDAYAFVLHEAGVAIAIYNNTSVQLPGYTVTDNGTTVSVCRDDATCESFGDFRIAGVLLDTFSIDGQPLSDRASTFERPTTVETLTIDGNYAVRRPRDEVLSVVVLLAAEGGGTTFVWERASYVDVAGRQFAIDPATSQFLPRLEDGEFNVAHLTFAGAQHGGQVVIPITNDLTRVATTIRIPVTLR